MYPRRETYYFYLPGCHSFKKTDSFKMTKAKSERSSVLLFASMIPYDL